MARALEQIMAELNSVYTPQKDVYNQQINALPGQQEAEMKGLEASKEDAFKSIVTGANRRGVAFGGIPLEEQSSYLGSQYLPAVANLKNRFQQNKFTLQTALAELAAKQAADARGIWQWEMEQDAARAAAGGGGGGGFDPGNLSRYALGDPGTTAPGAQTLRQQWQTQANAGDWEAQTLLNYVGDDGNYDGAVNSTAEYNILKKNNVTGNYWDAEAAKKQGRSAASTTLSKTGTGSNVYGPYASGLNSAFGF